MIRKFSIIIIVFTILFVGCGKKENDTKQNKAKKAIKNNKVLELKVKTPYGAPSLSMVKMIVDNPKIADNVKVNYEQIQSPSVLATSLINKEADIAIVPTNLATVIYNKQESYKILASSIWGLFYLVSSEDIKDIKDLKGKTLTLFGRGLSPDAIMRYILKNNGIDPDKDITLDFLSGGSEVAANFISGKSKIALIPQPIVNKVLMKRKDSKIVIDIQKAWTKVSGLENYPQASIVVKTELLKDQKDVIIKFLNEYEKSINWINSNPEKAGEYYVKLNIGLNSKLVEKAIPFSNIKYVEVSKAKKSLNSYLDVLFKFNPKILGGKPVNEGMYFEK